MVTGMPVTMSARSVSAVTASFMRQRTTRTSGEPPRFERKQVYMRRFVLNAGSTATPIIPPSPISIESVGLASVRTNSALACRNRMASVLLA